MGDSIDRNWFCYDGCDMNYFATQEEALNEATNAIEGMRDEYWPDEVENIYVGYITHESRKVNEVTADMLDAERCHNGKYYPGNFDYYCNYVMRPTEKERL